LRGDPPAFAGGAWGGHAAIFGARAREQRADEEGRPLQYQAKAQKAQYEGPLRMLQTGKNYRLEIVM